MSWRYRDRETKSFVSESTYNRSRSHGGTKFQRVSDAKWNVRGGASGSAEAHPKKEAVSGKPSSSKAPLPKTAKDYAKYYDQSEIEDYDREADTGVDY